VGGGALLLLGAVALLALFAFALLPRWAAAPVVTTTPTPVSPAPVAEPPPGSTQEAPAPAAPVAARPPSPRPEREGRSAPAAAPEADAWSGEVSAGFAALERGALDEAEAAFARAEALRPGSAAVADGRARIAAARVAHALVEQRRAAEAAEAREDWRAATAAYAAALMLEPAVAFAVAGRARSAERLRLDESLQRHLDRPDRLSTEAVAREVEALLVAANEASPAGPRLVAQRAALAAALAGARQPVAVQLRSDGVTRVTILRVGELGSFKERSLELRPGSYVVVGARPGYRDARRNLVVPVGRSPAPLDVRCDEAL
jgi:hypothetical protein